MADTSDKADGNSSAILSPGQYLRSCREATGMTPDDVAAELRVLPTFILFIEDDAYDKLPGDTFVRGYFRAYAKLLKLDGENVIQRYIRFRNNENEAPSGEFNSRGNSRLTDVASQEPLLTSKEAQKQATEKNGQSYLPWLVVGVLGFGFLLVWLGGDKGTPVNNENSSTLTDTVSENKAAEHKTDDSKDVEETLEEFTATPSSETVEVAIAGVPAQDASSTPEVSSVSSTFSETESVAGGGSLGDEVTPENVGSANIVAESTLLNSTLLTLTFRGDSWVEVTDLKGDVLLTDLKQAGQVSVLDGVPPYKLFLGNGAVVDIEYQGEPVPVSPDPAKNIARLVVGKEQ